MKTDEETVVKSASTQKPPLSAKFDEKSIHRDKSKSSKSRSPDKNKSAKSRKSAKSLKSGKCSRSARSRKSAKSVKTSAKKKSTAEQEDLSDLGLTILDNKIFEKTTLRRLILSGNNLRSIPSSISDLFNLEYLDISRNPLRVKDAEDASCFPIEMRLLKILKFISISECNLRHVPTTIWMCSSLETLDLSRNKISLLVPDVGNLQNLQSINLSQCNLSTLPNEIGFCSDLKEIILMGNQIESLPDSLKDCDNLEVLKLSYRNFSSMLDSYMENLIFKGQIKSEHIPVVVFELASMVSLDLKHTRINTIPDNNLKGLKELNLDYNYISTLVENSMKSMINITVLTISNNFLKEIPMEINSLLSLQVLDLSFNTISKISNNSNLFNLKELYLNCNKLEEINSNVKYFKSLQKLRLDRNTISEIAEELYSLELLDYLDLCYNRIICLSEKLSKLKSLKLAHSYAKLQKIGLWLIGNPLKIPPTDYWSTTNMDKMFNFLSSYTQRNLDYVYYSKLIFIGLPGVGKSSLIDSFYFIVEKDEQKAHKYQTKLARKLFKRTVNKVEWSILDIAGHEMYRSFHSTLFSSIDPDNEPTLFVIVYDHTEYKSCDHDKHIGDWLISILMHSRPSPTNNTVNIKLIGIVHDILFDFYDENKEEEFKMNNILTECGLTIDSYYQKLIEEKIKTENANDLERIELLLNRRVYLNGDIFLIESNYSKESITKCLNCLENITISFNQIIPLELKIKLKNHITKIKKRTISLTDFKLSIDTDVQLNRLMKMYEKYNLNTDKIINYAKTMSDIFWFKYDTNQSDEIYLHFDNLLNTLKTIIRHDLVSTLVFDDKSIFKTIGLFESEEEFTKTCELYKNYGVMEWKLLQGVAFEFNQMERKELEEHIKLWQKLYMAYKSETEFIGNQCSFINIVIPMQCKESFKNAELNNTEMAELFTDDYEKYFMRIDLTHEYCEKVKYENVLKKKRFAWKFKEKTSDIVENLDNLDENIDETNQLFNFDDESKLINLSSIKVLEIASPLIQKDYKNPILSKAIIKCWSNLKIEKHLFHKLSCLVQDLFNERFDWSDTIIARDCQSNFFKLQLFEEFNSNKILIEIKSSNLEDLKRLKSQFLHKIDYLFSFYPGLLLIKNVT